MVYGVPSVNVTCDIKDITCKRVLPSRAIENCIYIMTESFWSWRTNSRSKPPCFHLKKKLDRLSNGGRSGLLSAFCCILLINVCSSHPGLRAQSDPIPLQMLFQNEAPSECNTLPISWPKNYGIYLRDTSKTGHQAIPMARKYLVLPLIKTYTSLPNLDWTQYRLLRWPNT